MDHQNKRKQRMKIILVGVLIAIVIFMIMSDSDHSDSSMSSLITDDTITASSCPFASTAMSPQTESFIVRPQRW